MCLNFSTFPKHLLPIFMSWFCPAFWWWDSNIYLVFSVFTSRPISLPASIKVCVFLFFFMVSLVLRYMTQVFLVNNLLISLLFAGTFALCFWIEVVLWTTVTVYTRSKLFFSHIYDYYLFIYLLLDNCFWCKKHCETSFNLIRCGNISRKLFLISVSQQITSYKFL
jgi:hypothetical protein